MSAWSLADLAPPYTQEGSPIQTTPFSIAGRLGGDAFVTGNGGLRSESFVTGQTGWRIQGDGTVEFNTGTFRGSLVAGQIHIPDEPPTPGLHVDQFGNMWWGVETTYATAIDKIGGDGTIKMSDTNGASWQSVTAQVNAGFRFDPERSLWEHGDILLIPGNLDLANEWWQVSLRSPYYIPNGVDNAQVIVRGSTKNNDAESAIVIEARANNAITSYMVVDGDGTITLDSNSDIRLDSNDDVILHGTQVYIENNILMFGAVGVDDWLQLDSGSFNVYIGNNQRFRVWADGDVSMRGDALWFNDTVATSNDKIVHDGTYFRFYTNNAFTHRLSSLGDLWMSGDWIAFNDDMADGSIVDGIQCTGTNFNFRIASATRGSLNSSGNFYVTGDRYGFHAIASQQYWLSRGHNTTTPGFAFYGYDSVGPTSREMFTVEMHATSKKAVISNVDEILAVDGVDIDPSYTFASEQTTGMYKHAAGICGLAGGGVASVAATTTGVAINNSSATVTHDYSTLAGAGSGATQGATWYMGFENASVGGQTMMALRRKDLNYTSSQNAKSDIEDFVVTREEFDQIRPRSYVINNAWVDSVTGEVHPYVYRTDHEGNVTNVTTPQNENAQLFRRAGMVYEEALATSLYLVEGGGIAYEAVTMATVQQTQEQWRTLDAQEARIAALEAAVGL